MKGQSIKLNFEIKVLSERLLIALHVEWTLKNCPQPAPNLSSPYYLDGNYIGGDQSLLKPSQSYVHHFTDGWLTVDECLTLEIEKMTNNFAYLDIN